MYAHMHIDVFKLVMGVDNPENPVAMLTICSSLTTWTAFNPSFCVYEVDAETFLPVKRVAYSVDLTTANESGELVWN